MKYVDKAFHFTVSDGLDKLTVSKVSDSAWSHVHMTRGDHVDTITLGSRDMAHALYFLIGKLLTEEK